MKPKELERLGKAFIEKQIEIQNETQASLFEGLLYDENFLQDETWDNGARLFYRERIADEKDVEIRHIREYYNSLSQVLNMFFIRLREKTEDFNHTSLRIHLQTNATNRLEAEIESLKTRKDTLTESNKQFNTILDIDEALNELYEEYKKQNPQILPVRKDIETPQMKFEKRLKGLKASAEKTRKLIAKDNSTINKLDKQIKEKESDANYITHLIHNDETMELMYKLLDQCCENCYYISLISIFLDCLNANKYKGKFDFVAPTKTHQYKRLREGLDSIYFMMQKHKLKNKDYEKHASRYINLSILDTYIFNSKISRQEADFINETYKTIDELLKSRKNIAKGVLDLERKYMSNLEKKVINHKQSGVVASDK